mmetsp:Transcript_28498/g.53443  ORF Transcript_28498/g.53443 Transcript_28498/m.53443 type:complete len:103 (-) Transcript_28498:909-1217(-)
MIVSATLEGQRFYKSEHRRPTGKEAWRVATRLAGAATALSVVLALVFFVSDPESAAVFGPVGFVVLFSVMFLLLWVFGRIFLSLGAWTAANSAAKRAERDET